MYRNSPGRFRSTTGIAFAVALLVAGCGHADRGAAPSVATSAVDVSLSSPGIALTAASPSSLGVFVLVRGDSGDVNVFHVSNEGSVSTAPLGIDKFQFTIATHFFFAEGSLWLNSAADIYRISPTEMTVDQVLAPTVPSSDGDALGDGDAWISSTAVADGRLYVSYNTKKEVYVNNLSTGEWSYVAIPSQYAGSQAMAVDGSGWLYLGGSESHPNGTAILDPSGRLVAEIDNLATQMNSDPDGRALVPTEGACNAYLGGAVVAVYDLGRTPTACMASASSGVVIGWNVESGGYSITKGGSITDHQPVVTPTVVVNPQGHEVSTSTNDACRSMVLTAEGRMWTLAKDGVELTAQSM